MNKHDLVEALSQRTKKPKPMVAEVLEAALQLIQETVSKGDDVTLSGFGTFLLGKRKASKGFNPHTGGSIDLPEMRVPKFRPGKGFKERLKKR